jgi:hypothetical protein
METVFAIIYDPHFLIWCNLISDMVTTVASLGACTAAVLHFRAYLRDKAKQVEKDL